MLALVLLCLAQFVAVLDGTLVLVALPAIGRDLGLSPGALQWVVTAYVLVFAGCLLVAGRTADAFGRRRVFLGGFGLFTVASLACGLAPTAEVLVGARAVQGLGAAFVAPSALAMIIDLFPEGDRRERAISAWTGVAAVGGAAGLVLGGVIAELVGWRWIFLVNVPVGIVTLALVPRVLAESRAESDERGFDLAGAAAATLGLGLLVFALAQAEDAGPLAPLTLAALVGALMALLAFAAHERTAARPLVPGRLIGTRALAAAVLAGALLTATTSGGSVIASLHLQDVLRLQPASAGLLLLPFSVAAALGSLFAARLPVSAQAAIVGGVGLVGVGSAVAAAAPTSLGIAVWGVLCGLGIGIASVNATNLGASAVPEADRGTAAGLLNTAAQVGTAVGIAALVLVAGTASPDTGHRVAFAAASALAALGGLVLFAALRPAPSARGATPAPERARP
jgi:EmrB/QacA subfamily drug resistance transporter